MKYCCPLLIHAILKKKSCPNLLQLPSNKSKTLPRFDHEISNILKAKVGQTEKQEAIKNLSKVVEMMEQNFEPNLDFDKAISRERNESYKYGGRSVFGKAQKPAGEQLDLF